MDKLGEVNNAIASIESLIAENQNLIHAMSLQLSDLQKYSRELKKKDDPKRIENGVYEYRGLVIRVRGVYGNKCSNYHGGRVWCVEDSCVHTDRDVRCIRIFHRYEEAINHAKEITKGWKKSEE